VKSALTADVAERILYDVAGRLSLDVSGARLLGPVGDNAVYLLPREHTVARIAQELASDRVERELRVAAWLAEQEFPAVHAVAGIRQPVRNNGHIVTFWREIPDPVQASTSQMGVLLRHLHALPVPPDGLIGRLDPFVRLAEHIEEATGISEDERAFLAERLTVLMDAHAKLVFTMPMGVVHGDAHRKNVVRDAAGRVLLLDLERFGIGQPEWDLIVPAVYLRVGWYDEDTYRAFADAYGYDIREWDGYPVLAELRELRMTSWLAARTGREPRLIPEARKRITSLKDPSAERRWTPGT
jgi:aminoglycoside phosphotransferase (APT) family kinase protein